MVEVMKVALLGFYGMNNYGDDVFCYMFLNEFKKRGCKVKVYGARPLVNEGVESCGLFFKGLYGNSRYLDKILRVINNLIAVFSSDVLVFGGGSVFGKYASFKQRALVILLAKILGRHIYAIGVSYGPFLSQRERSRYRFLIDKLTRIVVRDSSSAGMLVADGVKSFQIQEDVAFSLPTSLGSCPPDIDRKRVGRYVVVALHLEEYIESAVEIVKRFDASLEEVIVLSLEEQSDKLTSVLESRLRGTDSLAVTNFTYRGFSSPVEEVTAIISGAHFMVTSKLHGAVISAAYGVPFALFEYQEKCTDLCSTMGYDNLALKMPVAEVDLQVARRQIKNYLISIKGLSNAIEPIVNAQ